MIIRPQALTAQAFAPFGTVLEAGVGPAARINDGRTLRFGPLARLALDGEDAAVVYLYRSEAVACPYPIRRLERHVRSSQLFMPLHDRPFPVVVAPPAEQVRSADVVAFMSNGHQGVCLNADVWHHAQLTLEQAGDYLVVESRHNPGHTRFIDLDGEALLTL